MSYASKNGHNKVVRELLEEGADPNIKTFKGMSPLLLGCISKRINYISGRYLPVCHTRVVTELLKYNADTEVSSDEEHIPICYAYYVKNFKGIPGLSEAGYTPIFYACYAENFKVISALSEVGANLNKICRGDTPLIYTAKNNFDINIIKRLLDYGAVPSIQIDGKTNLLEFKNLFLSS